MPAPRRVSASERFRDQVDVLFGSERELGSILEEVARLGVALLFQVAIEAEVTEFLCRERYGRGERSRQGMRNGYSPVTIKTTAGPITMEKPKLRATTEPFASRLLGIGVTRTKALESLVIASFVRGLSVRDVEATLGEALGEQAALSKSTVSQICQVLISQFQLWSRRDLSDYVLDYLYCDATFFKYHQAASAEPLLCSWDHHRRREGLHRSGRWQRREPRRLARALRRSQVERAEAAPARDHRRCPRLGRRLRAGLRP